MHLTIAEVLPAAPGLLIGAADLIAICAVVVLIGLLLAIEHSFQVLFTLLDFSILGHHPLHGLVTKGRNVILGSLERGISYLEGKLISLYYGLIWCFKFTARMSENFAHAVWDAFHHTHIYSIPHAAEWALHTAQRQVTALKATVAADVTALHKLITQAENLAKAEALAAERIAISTAERYAESLVAPIVGQLATLRDLVNITRAAERTAETAIGDLRAAEAAAVGALEQAESLTQQELRDLLDRINAGDIAALLASVPFLITLVRTLEAETGLDNALCRGKVKQICGTDPALWAGLLEGLVALGFLLSLRELVPIGRTMIRDLRAIVEQAA